ncbi:MAG TPA: hypothetical protein VGN57_21260 [Pirellulaceae bacterium]|nr:hypothetical protein [Pirellulaceae bacterium]
MSESLEKGPIADQPIEAEWTIESGERFLRLVLSRAGDRYAHRIELLSADGELVASATSEEGATASIADASESWPASPPFQQFHRQEIDGRPAWFFVGMAGKSHWSASVTARDDVAGWEFDVACRYREAPGYLGSAYRVSFPDDRLPRPAFFTLITGETTELRGSEDIVAAVPSEEGRSDSLPASARWRYVCAFS